MAIIQDSPLFKKNGLNAVLAKSVPSAAPVAPASPAPVVSETVKVSPSVAPKQPVEETFTIRATPSVQPAPVAPAVPVITERPVKPQTDMWKAFGSPAMVVAALGGRMTKRPLVAALNAGTAVMKAQAAKDDAAYAAALDEWKANTDAAMKNYEYQRDAYKDAYERNISDRTTQAAELKALASAFGDNAGLAILNGQGTGAFMDHNAGIGKLMNSLGVAALQIKPGGAAGKTKDERYMQRIKELESKDVLTDEEQQDLKFYREALATSARGGMDPMRRSFDTKAGGGLGEEYMALQAAAANIPDTRAKLQQAYQATENLGIKQGPVIGKFTPDISADAQILNSEGVKQALEFVNKTKGAVSDKEMDLFAKASVSTSSSKEFNQNVLKLAMAKLARDDQMVRFYDMWKEKYGTTDGAGVAFKKFAEENPIFRVNGTKIEFILNPDSVPYDTSWVRYLQRQGGADTTRVSAPSNSDGWVVEELKE